MPQKHKWYHCFLILISFGGFLFLASCAPLYFHQLRPPAQPLAMKDLNALTYSDLWQGFVFNGEKVGFAHLRIEKQPRSNKFILASEAHLRIFFLGMDKRITVKGVDVVGPDLDLLSFHYELTMDQRPLFIDGDVINGQLQWIQKSGDHQKRILENLKGSLYPASAINIYPVIKGLAVGNSYRYAVFDPQSQTVTEVTQYAKSFEESLKFNLEPAFQIETRMHDQKVTTWINPKGEAIFELAMGGVLISYKEDEVSAKRFLSDAIMNKKDMILDFSLIKTDKDIACPRETSALGACLEGLGDSLPPLSGPGQSVVENPSSGCTSVLYRIERNPACPSTAVNKPVESPDLQQYLSASHHIESDDLEIKKVSGEITSGATTACDRLRRLNNWVSEAVTDEALESFSALDVLHNRKGECQAHTLLYTALARASGIPTKIVGGIVYVAGLGFLYHSWAESYVGGWIAVDPTFNQVGVDATHIKLVEGPSWTSILSLSDVIGKLSANITGYESVCSP